MVGTFTIAVLGSPGVGKTAIIRQFLYNDFNQVYTPTRTRYVHRPSVILNNTMYDLKIVDVPQIPTFPSTRAQEWSDSRCRGIRNANAYVLVYDICCFDSFEYVKMIRQQIAEVRLHIFLQSTGDLSSKAKPYVQKCYLPRSLKRNAKLANIG
ncbi:ras-like protein family member 10A isoform X3 [Heptranchias perlo]|uniref:ras-like protein family member 10A isoform X3 n=1 Tax=Heptranchias perlo TaxID=212740 RepID=UPI00355ABFCA